jgi:hypothetical protein
MPPESETFRTTQLIEPLSNAITPAFRVRRRTFFRLSDTANDLEARAIKKQSPFLTRSAVSRDFRKQPAS